MKKTLLILCAVLGVVMSAKADVDFAYDAGAEVVSAYIWRGQYNGGLSFQPDLEIGFDAMDEAISFRAGVWGNIGASDWQFKKKGWDAGTGVEEPGEYTRFMPELDVVLSFSFFGASVGFNHYYYCDGSNFFSWQKDNVVYDNGYSSTTEFWFGYNFDHFFGVGAYINWYTTIAGNDFIVNELSPVTFVGITNEEVEVYRRAWSSYLEVGYDYTFEDLGLTLGAQIGMSPWASDLYGNEKFAVTNLSLKINKEWEFDAVTLDLFAQGSLNPDGLNKENVYIKGCGYDKLYNQKLNGVIGLGIWF